MNRELEAKIHERTHELAEANARLAQLAVTDGLTGLYNHRHFHERLALEVERSQRSGLPLSLLMLDVDHFKQFNDTFGHPAADDFTDAAPRAGRITISIGAATYPDDGADAEALVRAADTALYGAKRAGRNRVVLATESLSEPKQKI